MQRINYQLFRQRKNFNPTVLFKNNLTLSYEDFSKFFIDRNVEPPSESYYMNVKRHCESLTEVQPKEQDVIPTVVEEVVAVNVEEVQPVQEESVAEVFTFVPEEAKETVELVEEALKVVEEKPKRRRRRKKKAESDE